MAISITNSPMPNDSRIEAVIACVKYSKFLEISLPENKKFFDNIIVVTTPSDIETQNVCLRNRVRFVTTNRFYENGAPFDRGSALNEGLKNLSFNEWVCHLDSDIILPDDFREKLNLKSLDKETFHGCSRFYIEKLDDWIKFKNKEKFEHEFYNPDPGGGHGCGFTQIWHMKANKIKHIDVNYLYPSYPTTSESDILMLKRFHPYVHGVGRLPINVIHLGIDGVSHDGKDDTSSFFSK